MKRERERGEKERERVNNTEIMLPQNRREWKGLKQVSKNAADVY